jgi:predicted hydrolase (HD superfamily)
MLEIQAILGHSQVSTTERYSHLSRSAAHEAADKVSGDIAAALATPTRSADIIDMRERRRQKAK